MQFHLRHRAHPNRRWRSRLTRTPRLHRQCKLSTPHLRSNIRSRTQIRSIHMLIFVRQCNTKRSAFVGIHGKCERGAVGRHEVRPPRTHNEPLSILVVRAPRSFNNNKYGRYGELRQRNILTGVACNNHHFELTRGGRVPHYSIIPIGGSSGVDGGSSHGIREHAHQVVDILEFGSEACAYDVVGACHAFDDFSGDVGVGLVGRHVETLSRGNQHVVEQKRSHGTRVSGELGGQTQDGTSTLSFPRWLLVRMDVIAALLDL
mmetsp:Transcript_15276/g.27775  ORF Transcript_15276/g.27775 Transcript_15276/m.27775 type:complete len:261 (-) Transcript_15276:849-1631(-)